MTQSGTEPRSLGPLSNTLPTRPTRSMRSTLTGTTNPGRVDLGVMAMKRVLNITQNPRTGASPSDCLVL